MLLGSALIKVVAIILFIGLGLLGALMFAGFRRGWMRNGYFTIPSVILIVIAIFIAFQGVGSGITLSLLGKDFSSNPLLALTINGLSQIIVMMGGALLVSQSANQNLFAVFRLEGLRQTPGAAYMLALPIIIAAQVASVNLVGVWTYILKLFPTLYATIEKYETTADKAVEALVTARNSAELIIILFLVALIPAFAEEVLFRGFAQSNIERSGYKRTRSWSALLVASFLFALIHGSLFKLPGLLAIALVLGWMAYRTNNLFVGSVGHAVNNGAIVILLYLKPNVPGSETLVGASDFPIKYTLISLVAVLPILGFLLYFFNRVTESIEARHNPEREMELLNSHEADDAEHIES